MKKNTDIQPYKAPCVGCEERAEGCHGKCERYAEYRRLIDEYKGERKLEGESLAYLRIAVDRMKKPNKKGRRG